ncbi:MAG TPA: hypothetical protein VN026_16080 [Bacteroidia bacterium]|jgi:hypothetical protein|nr:hypothetical protein [Bacteroidia bacterium]
MRINQILIFLLICNFSIAQRVKDTCMNIPLAPFHFAGQTPMGDLKQRFGDNLDVGAGFLYKFRKSWTLGAEGSYFFSKNVKEDVTKQMKNSEGFIVDNEGFPADLRITERGFTAYLLAGRVFPKLGHNPNSGLMINLGFGYLQHKIKLYDANKKIAAVKGDLAKGYDRLSGGFAMQQFIGYLFLSNNRLVNMIAGFEFHEAFTKSYRGFNYDTGLPDTKRRTDYLIGFRIAWVLPLYKRTQDFYYN